ncbi:hypothetical protein VPH35_045740 [Triticum aestivum]
MYSQQSFRDIIHWHSLTFVGASLWKAKFPFENQGMHVINGSRLNANMQSRFLNVKDHAARIVSYVVFLKTKTASCFIAHGCLCVGQLERGDCWDQRLVCTSKFMCVCFNIKILLT